LISFHHGYPTMPKFQIGFSGEEEQRIFKWVQAVIMKKKQRRRSAAPKRIN
jgi:hypothetical protein